jgi:site-specific recombinase XerD
LVDLGLIAVFQGRGSHSLSFIALDEATNVRRAYAGISVKLDGKAFAANSFSTKLRALRGLAQYGVERGFFESSPLRRVKVPRRRVSPVVDRRGVANSSQAAALFAAVPQCGRTGRRLVAFYKTIYFAGLRPGEVLALRQHDCHLPETGWGELAFEESTPYAGARWTNDGTAPA